LAGGYGGTGKRIKNPAYSFITPRKELGEKKKTLLRNLVPRPLKTKTQNGAYKEEPPPKGVSGGQGSSFLNLFVVLEEEKIADNVGPSRERGTR